MNEYLLPADETPLTISQFGLYPKYRRDGVALLRSLKGQTEAFIESAFDLFNERLMKEGNVPCVADVIFTIHADAVIEAGGTHSVH